MFVCNVDGDAASYEEAKNLSAIVEVVNRFNKTYLPLFHVMEKEKQDYVFCINQSLKFNPKYSLIVEDDAIPREDFFSVVHHVIDNHLEHRFRRGDFVKVNETVLYVKLYHPERLLGYLNLEPDRLTELFGWGFVLGTLLMVIYKKFIVPPKQAFSRSEECAVHMLFILYSMLLVICVGRPHIAELRRMFSPALYSFMSAPECCTPAMLFPATGAQLVIDHLNSVSCLRDFGKDMALEKFRHSKEHFKTYMVQPNLVTHIGLYSSLRRVVLDPFIV